MLTPTDVKEEFKCVMGGSEYQEFCMGDFYSMQNHVPEVCQHYHTCTTQNFEKLNNHAKENINH